MALWQTSPSPRAPSNCSSATGVERGSAYEALAERIRLLIVDGRIAVDTRLPAERDLADRLGLSRTTVTAAYRHLREQGNLHSVRGSGSVARLPGRAGDAARAARGRVHRLLEGRAARAAVADRGRAAGASTTSRAHLVRRGVRPDRHARPAAGHRRPLHRARPADRRPSRSWSRSAPSTRSPCSPARSSAAATAPSPRCRSTRTPTRRSGRPAPASCRCPSAPREADDDDREETAGLVQAIRHSNPVAAYLIPDFQNPTGRTMSRTGPRPRARRGRTPGHRRRRRRDHRRALDRPHRARSRRSPPTAPAVLIGSVGKTVWGGLRVGWIRAERPLIRRLLAVRSPGDLGTPILEQLIVTRLIDRMDEILELRREQLRAGRDRLEELLARYLPRVGRAARRRRHRDVGRHSAPR